MSMLGKAHRIATRAAPLAPEPITAQLRLGRRVPRGALSAPICASRVLEQMELSRVRAENARLRMEVEILNKATGVVVSNYSIESAFTRLGYRSSSANRLVARAS